MAGILEFNRELDPDTELLDLGIKLQAAENDAALADLVGGDTGVLNALLLLNSDVDGFNPDWRGHFRIEKSILPDLDSKGRTQLSLSIIAVHGNGLETAVKTLVFPHAVPLDDWLVEAGQPRRGDPGMRPYQIVLDDASATTIPVAASLRGAQLTNGGCTGAKDEALPAAQPGRRIGLLVTAAFNFRAHVVGTDKIVGGGIDPSDTCIAVNSSDTGSVIWLTCGFAGEWTIDLGQVGFNLET